MCFLKHALTLGCFATFFCWGRDWPWPLRGRVLHQERHGGQVGACCEVSSDSQAFQSIYVRRGGNCWSLIENWLFSMMAWSCDFKHDRSWEVLPASMFFFWKSSETKAESVLSLCQRGEQQGILLLPQDSWSIFLRLLWNLYISYTFIYIVIQKLHIFMYIYIIYILYTYFSCFGRQSCGIHLKMKWSYQRVLMDDFFPFPGARFFIRLPWSLTWRTLMSGAAPNLQVINSSRRNMKVIQVGLSKYHQFGKQEYS